MPLDPDTESEVKRVQALIAEMGAPSTWNPRFAKSLTKRLQAYEARIQLLLEEHHKVLPPGD